jgi:hypothetical protein
MAAFDAVGFITPVDAVTAASGVSTPFALSMADVVSVLAEWGTGVSAGTVTLETASTATYSGTWETALTITYVSGAAKVQTDSVEMAANVGRIRWASLADGALTVKVVRKIRGT